MEYYKQFNVVMNALDNRGEVASMSWTRGHFIFLLGEWEEGYLLLSLFL